VKAIKSDKAMSKKKVVSFCEEEIRGDTTELATKKLWADLQRIVEKRGRTGKKRCRVTPEEKIEG